MAESTHYLGVDDYKKGTAEQRASIEAWFTKHNLTGLVRELWVMDDASVVLTVLTKDAAGNIRVCRCEQHHTGHLIEDSVTIDGPVPPAVMELAVSREDAFAA